MDRTEQKKQESARLYEIYKQNPELFARSSTLENGTFLRDFGICIPGKDAFPRGYLKLYPSDFIVEEIAQDGTISTIERPTTPILVPEKEPGNDSHRALFATLVKCNIATHEAVAEMAKATGAPVKNIHYAGLKDKYAITAQAISFHDISPEKIRAISSQHYFLKDFRFGKGSIEKGALKGNRFTLFIRTPEAADSAAFSDKVKVLSKNGFYNYYYLQRFGIPRMTNFRWGFNILRGKYKECIVDFLTSTNEREIPYFQKLRGEIQAVIPDWKAVSRLLEPYPVTLINENRIAAHLLAHPEDYVGALQAVEEQTMLWIYGFTSLIFNEMVSRHVQANTPLPATLPLLLSNKPEDIALYADLLTPLNYYPPRFEAIRPFPGIQLQRRMIKTTEKISIENVTFSPGGIALRFSLDKGQYATTFLSHLFNIISGNPPEDIAREEADVFSLLDKTPHPAVLEYFRGINASRSFSAFEEFDQN